MTQRGDVVIVKFPFTDVSRSKARPAIVVQNNRDNQKIRKTKYNFRELPFLLERGGAVMKHVNLDAQDETIKQFVLTLSVDPEGAFLELNGRALVCVLPVPSAESQPEAAEEWTEEKNARRCALVDREIAGTLTLEEARELNYLQKEMLRYRRRVAPLPLEYARALHQQLLAQARAHPGSST